MFWSKPPPPSPSPAENANPAPPPPPPLPQTREEQADSELAALIAELDREHTENARATERNKRVPAANDDKTGLPTEMNCLTAFDEMFYCYSFGGQFLNIYRYGSFRDCSEKSADWRFCMKTKVRGEVARRAMILARNKEKAAKYKVGKSSEDVWNVRKEPVKDAFNGNFEDLRDTISG
ncbi:hypothetical protein FN846DRAFT_949419 [Sphaerosporella brunnea]|uniref:DUF3128 domain-containing protein n=1 Tax=Sphaerosporella brunnea TaxID=1250544 RepID=A0A5J5EW46_9PEZI|nr:hypothetical protein FN846DRAFT_949391 [Sphaerosporella brunnea]KAA8905973.1 hypothetical protein FN846DRAFT_949419 [Sphaerosporella brunnea]